MDDFTIAIYCFSDDYCKLSRSPEDVKRKLNDAEVITTALVSARYFSCNLSKGCDYMCVHWGCKKLDKSNFNRLRLMILSLFRSLGDTLKELNTNSIYVIDSFPVVVCRNICIPNCRLLQEEGYRGYNASKKGYFYGFKDK